MKLETQRAATHADTGRGQAEREMLITDNVDLVHYVVSRVAANLPQRVEREDLVSAGLIGLIKAADRFDPQRGIKFRTYASTVVRGEVMESLREKDWAPRSVRRKARELAAAVAELEGRLHRAPTDLEIADSLDMDLEGYYDLLSNTSGANLLSLDELLEEWQIGVADGMTQFAASDSDNPAQIADKAALLEIVANAVERLPERDRLVVNLYYHEELTLQEIGQVLGVTESRVCQIHTQAITRLRAAVYRSIELQ